MVHYYLSLATANIVPMSYPNSSSFPDSNPQVSSGFNAQSDMGLAEVLQMCCLSRRSGQITFRSGESHGFVFIQQGHVIHAMCGPIEGEEAIFTMLTWPGGGFTLNEDILPHKKTVTLTWEQLLFEGARRADEGLNTPSGAPIVTAEPVISTRAHESQPKLMITRPDLPPVTFELVQEYTHLGRAAGNEISMPYPSISSRHCIFILSGPDVVVRDLNSSNGTLVNDEPIAEAVLRPGDIIRTGVLEIKFEAGMKRPKLRAGSAHVPAPRSQEPMNEVEAGSSVLTHNTVKLPGARNQASGASATGKSDSAYVKGVSAINYSDLAKPVETKKKPSALIIVAGIVVVLAAGAAVYFLYLR
jgi:pSer/pThr/pTyr-binding forkhead associated (FHA) protein